MAITVDTPRARQLGAELKALRMAAGTTTTLLGQRVGRSHTHISRWENGKLLPNERDMASLLTALNVRGKDRDRLFTLAREAADPNWIAPGMDRQLAGLMEYERTATQIVDVEPLMIPGLLQTADYARSIMIGAGATRGDAEKRVTLRMGRRDALTRRNPVRFSAIVGEHALRYSPCDRSMMADQLHQLRQMADRRNVTIRALPLDSGYTPALEGPFALIEFEKTRPVVHLEHYRSTAILSDPRDIQDYQAAVDILSKAAMSEAATAKLIAQLVDEMEHET